MNTEMTYRITLAVAGIGLAADDERLPQLIDLLEDVAPNTGPVLSTTIGSDLVHFTLMLEASDVLRAGEAVCYIAGNATARLGLPLGRPVSIEGEEVPADELAPAAGEPVPA